MIKTRINLMLGIKYPILLEGIPNVSGSKLVAAVSEAGGFGVLCAGAKGIDFLIDEIIAVKETTDKPFGLKLFLDHKDIEKQIEVAIEEKVPAVITSRGEPAKYTRILKEKKIRVIHEAVTVAEAKKCEESGVDAIVARGMESSGRFGKDLIGTMVLTPLIADAVKIPVIASGGIVDGRSLAASISIGAEGVMMGTRFISTWESTAHENYREAIVKGNDVDTLVLNLAKDPIRLLKNKFSLDLLKKEQAGEDITAEITPEVMALGMMEGDLENGACIAGQGIGLIKSVKSARDVIREMLYEIMVIGDQFGKYAPSAGKFAETE